MKVPTVLGLCLAIVTSFAQSQQPPPTNMDEYLQRQPSANAPQMRNDAGRSRAIQSAVQRGRGDYPAAKLPFDITPALLEQCTKACVANGGEAATCAASCNRKPLPRPPR